MGRIVGVKVLDVSDYGRGGVKITELHSTKGWRAPYWVSPRGFWRRPRIGEYIPARKPSEKRVIPPREPTERELMRHGWYRRQQRKLEAAHA